MHCDLPREFGWKEKRDWRTLGGDLEGKPSLHTQSSAAFAMATFYLFKKEEKKYPKKILGGDSEEKPSSIHNHHLLHRIQQE